MKITVEIDEAMGRKIDLEARKDGHSNRNAVIRKALNLFFDDAFSSVHLRERKNEQNGEQNKD